MILGGSLGGVLVDQLVGVLLVGDDERELREPGLQLSAHRAVGPHVDGPLQLDLGLRRHAGEFDQELVIDADLLRLLQAARELADGRLGRVTRFDHELVHSRLELLLDLHLLAGRAREEGDPLLVERRRCDRRGLAGGGELLALKVGVLGFLQSELAGSGLGRHHLGPGGLEVLLRERLPHLLDEDEAGHQGERPQHRSNSEGVPTEESKR